MQEPGAMAGPRPGADAAYAGFFPRLISLIIDGLVVGVISWIVGTVLPGGQGSTLSTVVGLVLGIVYYVYFFTSSGQTLGAKVMGIKLVDGNGQNLSVGSAVVRVIVGYVSGMIIFIGYLWMLWDSKKQTLHDKAAGSYVVKL
jgi:uncharacterized RDD family membrane protein YckC